MRTYEERLDKAAVILCDLRGQDPNEVIYSDGSVTYRPPVYRWHLAREELTNHRQRDEAFELAGQRP